MEPVNLLAVRNRSEFRNWLASNHDKEKECWATVRRGRPVDDDTFWYIDAVEEALCFGWIDSTVKKLDTGAVIQRFTPRRKSSAWTELNKERCRRLERLGLMTDAGRAVLPDMSPAGFVVDDAILNAKTRRFGITSMRFRHYTGGFVSTVFSVAAYGPRYSVTDCES